MELNGVKINSNGQYRALSVYLKRVHRGAGHWKIYEVQSYHTYNLPPNRDDYTSVREAVNGLLDLAVRDNVEFIVDERIKEEV